MSNDALTEVLGERVPVSRLYVDLRNEADPQQVAATLESQNIKHGVQARTFRAVVAQRQQENLQFLRILQGYLMLGLLVGVAGLGVLMVRAVRERRRQIGMLRSVGLQSATVGRSFMLEAGFVSLQGIIVGGVLAAVTAYQLVANAGVLGDLDVGFSLPWLDIAVIALITLAASVAAAWWPARRASRIRPAVALRNPE